MRKGTAAKRSGIPLDRRGEHLTHEGKRPSSLELLCFVEGGGDAACLLLKETATGHMVPHPDTAPPGAPPPEGRPCFVVTFEDVEGGADTVMHWPAERWEAVCAGAEAAGPGEYFLLAFPEVPLMVRGERADVDCYALKGAWVEAGPQSAAVRAGLLPRGARLLELHLLERAGPGPEAVRAYWTERSWSKLGRRVPDAGGTCEAKAQESAAMRAARRPPGRPATGRACGSPAREPARGPEAASRRPHGRLWLRAARESPQGCLLAERRLARRGERALHATRPEPDIAHGWRRLHRLRAGGSVPITGPPSLHEHKALCLSRAGSRRGQGRAGASAAVHRISGSPPLAGM